MIYLKVNLRSSSKVALAVGGGPMELPTAASFRRSAAFYRKQAAREDDDWHAETLFLIAADFEAMANDITLVRSLARTASVTASSGNPRLAWLCKVLMARFGWLCSRTVDLRAN